MQEDIRQRLYQRAAELMKTTSVPHEVRDFIEQWRAWQSEFDTEQLYKGIEEGRAQEHKRTEQAKQTLEGDVQALNGKLLHAHEEERKLIAMELHNSIAASLAAIKLRLENIGQSPPPPPPKKNIQ